MSNMKGLILLSALAVFFLAACPDPGILSDAEAVSLDASSLTVTRITFSGSDSASSVTQDITLPSSGASGSRITWSSNNSAITSSGTVARPSPGSDNITVTMTATISKGESTQTKEFTIVVTAQSAVEAAVEALSTADITFGGSDSASSVTENITLPDTGTYSTTITWASSDTDTIDNTGNVTQGSYFPGTDISITLTATISDGTEEETKDFILTVKPADTPVLSDVIGDGTQAFTPGTGTAAQLYSPRGVCYDGTNLYGCDPGAEVIFKVNMTTKEMSLLAGDSGTADFADGTGASAQFNNPYDITYVAGYLYVLDAFNRRIRKINPSTGAVTTIVGDGTNTVADGTGTAATINWNARAITTDGTDLYFSDYLSVRKVNLSTLAVTTLCSNDGGPGLTQGFTQNIDGLEYYDGYLYATANNAGHCIFKIDATTGAFSVYAGEEGSIGNTDGTGTDARITQPEGITYDGNGFMYFTEQTRIKKINLATAEVITVLDTVFTELQYPMGIVFIDGLLYLSVQNHYKIMVAQ